MFLNIPTASVSITMMVLISTMLASCGFHLRGGVDIDANLQPVFIEQSGPIELRNKLSRLLQVNKVSLVTDKTTATSVLRLRSEKLNRRVLSVDSRGRARQYAYNYVVDYSINFADKKLDRKVSLSRDLLFDPDSVLAIDHETRALRKDMSDDAARLILQQLQAVH